MFGYNIFCFVLLVTLSWNVANSRNHLHNRYRRPNIIVIMTDDQDETLGSMYAMPKTLRIMRDGGAHFQNSFVTTPLCCPSRSSFLTGLYTHNHNVYTNSANCSSQEWRDTMESRSFATYLNNAGYRTGYFGKYLNQYNGKYIPAGWREWLGLVRNSVFYNYTINFNGMMIEKGDNYYRDYFTDLIANDSTSFFRLSKRFYPKRPVMMVLSTPAPHGPEDSAPQYQHMFQNNTSHRTPAWNYAPNLDKNFFLQLKLKMTSKEQKFTDVLHRKRLQTLQSVDDLVEKVYQTLRELDELDNTYIIFTSDHGYHLGQFGVGKGKSLPYDFDIRVPLYIRGPGIKELSKISNIVTNVDLAPTILDMAEIDTPKHMDGRSMLQLLESFRDELRINGTSYVTTSPSWKNAIFIQSGNPYYENRRQRGLFHYVRPLLTYTSRQIQTLQRCAKPEFQVPCRPEQEFYCVRKRKRKMLGMLRCPVKSLTPQKRKHLYTGGRRKKCKCRRKKIKHKDTVLTPLCGLLPNYTVSCDQTLLNNPDNWDVHRRSLSAMMREFKKMILDLKIIRKHLRKRKPFKAKFKHRKSFRSRKKFRSFRNRNSINPVDRRCRTFPNGTISCDRMLYGDIRSWRKHKHKIDILIPRYIEVVDTLKSYIRQFKKMMWEPKNGDNYQDQNCRCRKQKRYYRKRKQNRFKKKKKRQIKKQVRKLDRPAALKRTCLNPVSYSGDEDWRDHMNDPCFWNLKPKEKLIRKFHPFCRSDVMFCHIVDKSSWRTPPFWEDDPICICNNVAFVTYKCIRSINQEHNILYCEFGNSFRSYYNLVADPYQLRNVAGETDPHLLEELSLQLHSMSSCSGQQSCNLIL